VKDITSIFGGLKLPKYEGKFLKVEQNVGHFVVYYGAFNKPPLDGGKFCSVKVSDP
jgi:hypothetical protein